MTPTPHHQTTTVTAVTWAGRAVRHRCQGTVGVAALEAPLAIGFLLVPVAVLLLMVPTWREAQTVTAAAAAEAATLYATAPDPATGAAAARDAVDRTATNSGRALQLEVDGDWCRGCQITARVTVTVPAVAIPWIGSTGSFERTSTSTARISEFRSIGTQP